MTDKFHCSSESCLVHIKVMSEIESIKAQIAELKAALKDKIDTTRLDALLRQVEDMNARIDKLTESDIRQSEALAGIHAVLAEFKEIHKNMRDDYSKIADAQVDSSKNIATIMGILQGRNEVKAEEAKDPWYYKLLKVKPIMWVVIGTVAVLLGLIIFNWHDIVNILIAWANSGVPPVK